MITEYAGRTFFVALVIYLLLFDGLRVVSGTLYHIMGG